MHKQPSRTISDISSATIHRKYTKDGKTITIYTDSKITLDKLRNTKIHKYITEETRRKIIEMNKTDWEVKLCWVKAHAGISGNDVADTLGKKAATNESLTEEYNRIPESVVTRELEEEGVMKWQINWTQTTKGSKTKEYFPNVEERLKMELNLTKLHGNSYRTRKKKITYTDLKL
jgi:hypothetical protein